MELELWTDGSGISTGGQPIGWGWVLIARDGDELKAQRSGGGCGHNGTNNRAELMAVIDGLRTLTRPVVVTVYTDSEYVAKPFMEDYIVTWIENGWRNLGRRPVKNRDLWELLVEQCDRHVVTFKTIKGHNGHEHNERADRIAGAMRKALKEELAE